MISTVIQTLVFIYLLFFYDLVITKLSWASKLVQVIPHQKLHSLRYHMFLVRTSPPPLSFPLSTNKIKVNFQLRGLIASHNYVYAEIIINLYYKMV